MSIYVCKSSRFKLFGTLLPFIGYMNAEIILPENKRYPGSYFTIAWLSYSLFFVSKPLGC